MAGWISPALVAGGASVAVAGTLAYATLSAESQIFGRTVQAPGDPRQLALTFDDGPNPTATPRLLDVLASRNVRATFFLIGKFVREEPALARRIRDAGHVVGNHTMTHPFLPRHSAARIQAELRDCNRALEDVLGDRVAFFRAPHGAVRPAVFRAARELGLTTVQWNLIVGDWSAPSADVIFDRLHNGITRHRKRGTGTNAVLHDGGQSALGEPRLRTVEAVERLLQTLGGSTEYVVPSTSSGWV